MKTACSDYGFLKFVFHFVTQTTIHKTYYRKSNTDARTYIYIYIYIYIHARPNTSRLTPHAGFYENKPKKNRKT